MHHHMVCLLSVPRKRHGDDGDPGLPGSEHDGHVISLLHAPPHFWPGSVWQDQESSVRFVPRTTVFF